MGAWIQNFPIYIFNFPHATAHKNNIQRILVQMFGLQNLPAATRRAEFELTTIWYILVIHSKTITENWLPMHDAATWARATQNIYFQTMSPEAFEKSSQ